MREQLEQLQKQADTNAQAAATPNTPESVAVSDAPKREQKRDEAGRAWGLGRRKDSSARLYIVPGTGKFIVNKKNFDVYFGRKVSQMIIHQPLKVTNTINAFDIICTVNGGGLSGQAGAILHALSRALVNYDPDHYKILRTSGFMTRDPRVVERKKPGRPKARKKFQFSKR